MKVLFLYTQRILHRHFITGEGHHFCAKVDMKLVERGALEIGITQNLSPR